MPPQMFKAQAGAAHTAGIFADMTVDGPIIGDLVVVIDRARNLPNRKTMGKQDPYCAARLGKEAKKTDTDRRGGQTPKWDQELRFVVHESADYLKLKLSIFNEDRKTELIGETWLDLKDVIVRGGGQNDGWHRLNCKGRPAGEVRMEITFYDTREKPAEAIPKPSKQSEQLSGGPRSIPGRRPLPRGPGAVEQPTSRAQVPHSVSTSHMPSRPHPPEGALPRHRSTDATEDGLLDPQEHRRRMMVAHGVPYDPHASKADDRFSHHGGPRPVPGQSFSDLDRLRYRNRGVTLPEGLIQEDRQQQRHRRNTHEQPSLPQNPEPQYPEEPHYQDTYPPPQHLQQPLHNLPIHHEQPDLAYDRGAQFHHDDYAPEPALDYGGSYQPYVEEEQEAPPPPPPVHRSNVSSGPGIHAPIPSRYPPEPVQQSLQQGLAQLNAQNDDDFYNPTENTTQLTTHSDMAAPGHFDSYNHGHRPLPRSMQQDFEYAPSHQRSMQDMRAIPADDRQMVYHSPAQPNHHVRRQSFDPRNERLHEFDVNEASLANDFAPQHHVHRQPVLESHSHRDTNLGRTPPQHAQNHHAELAFHSSPADISYGRQPNPSYAPLIKPRAISPNQNSPHYMTPHKQTPPQQISAPPSGSSSLPRKSVEPRLSDIAFSPDSFDVLNPQVKNRPSTGQADSMTQSPHVNAISSEHRSPSPSPGQNSSDPIRDSTGRLVDPSDHLPTHTWAPEPEPKKPIKTEIKLRFKGAVPMPTTAPRAARPDVAMPAVNSSVYSSHLTEKPGDAENDKGKEGRNRLQKKVRVMMTSGGRKERRATEREASSPNNGTSQPLRDIPNVNYGMGPGNGNTSGPPPLPAKVPLDGYGQEENMGMDALSREISGIDLGAYSGRGDRRSRFATTLM